MKLSEVLSLNSKLTIPLLQKAYYDIIDKLKLDLHVFPVMMESNACRLGGFEYPAKTIDDNIIAFKEIPYIHFAIFEDSKDFDYDDNQFTIGDYTKEFAGFDETKFNECNAEQIDIPILYSSKHDYVCNNLEDLKYAMFPIFAYPYPYPVYAVNPIGTHTSYDIEIIIAEEDYETNELFMLDKLVPIIVSKAMSIYYKDNGNILEATHYDYMLATYINLYNDSVENIMHSMPNSMGILWQHQ